MMFDYSTMKMGEETTITYEEMNSKSEGILQKLSKATKRRSEYGNKPLNPQQKVPSKVITTTGRSNPTPMGGSKGGSKGRITYQEVS